MMSDDSASVPWLPLGPHFYRIEEDTMFVRTNGSATLDSTIQYTDLCRQLIAKNGYVISIVDMTVSGWAPPEVRRYQAQAAKEFPPGRNEIAIYGMNRIASTLVQLIARAAFVVTGREPSVVFVSDEEAALRWRDERRASIRAQLGRRDS